MQGSDTDSSQEKPKTTARNTVGMKLPLTIAALSLIAVEPALAQQTSQSAVCSADNLPGMIEGFFQLTTGLGIVGLAVVWQADSLIEMFTLNPDQEGTQAPQALGNEVRCGSRYPRPAVHRRRIDDGPPTGAVC